MADARKRLCAVFYSSSSGMGSSKNRKRPQRPILLSLWKEKTLWIGRIYHDKKKSHRSKGIGSSLDSLLEEDGMLAEATATAIKRVIAWELTQVIEKQGITKTEMARRMHTSRAALDRLLDPNNIAVTLHTMGRAAAVLGKRLRVELQA